MAPPGAPWAAWRQVRAWARGRTRPASRSPAITVAVPLVAIAHRRVVAVAKARAWRCQTPPAPSVHRSGAADGVAVASQGAGPSIAVAVPAAGAVTATACRPV